LRKKLKVRVFYRFAALAAFTIAGLLAQTEAAPQPAATSVSVVPELQPNLNDPGVIRAQRDLDRIKALIGEGGLPSTRLRVAEEDLQNALDMSILRANLYGKDLLPEQADQMVAIAQQMVLRKQRSVIEMRRLVESGAISAAEAESTGADYDRAQTELHLAETRAKLIQQMAESVRLRKLIASYSDEKRHAEAKDKQRKIEEAKKSCHLIFNATANKKISDLTVREEQGVRSCQARGYYE
jgi:hypothetical protein